MLATVALQQSRYQLALDSWRRSLELDPRHPRRYLLAVECAERHRAPWAAQAFVDLAPPAIAQMPGFRAGAVLPILVMRDQMVEAQALVDSLDESALDADGAVRVIKFLFKTGNDADAAERLGRAIARAQTPEEYSALASLARNRNLWSQCAECWQACIARFPGHEKRFKWQVSLAQALDRTQPVDQAMLNWQALFRRKPANMAVLLGYAACLLKQGDAAEARLMYQKAVEQGAGRTGLVGLAAATEQMGDGASALQCWREAVTMHPDDPDLCRRAVNCAVGLGDHGAAAALVALVPANVAARPEFMAGPLLFFHQSWQQHAAALALLDTLDEDGL